MPSLIRSGSRVGLVFLAVATLLRGGAGKDTQTESILRLIKQLGDDGFDKREAASKALEDIGEPALGALRKAAASSDDAEVRYRAKKLIETLRLQIFKKLMAKLEGTWVREAAESDGQAATKDNPPQLYVFKGDTVSVKVGGTVKQQARWKIVDVSGDSIKVDYSISEGVNRGGLVLGICTLEGDQMRWCYRFAPYDRPREFATKKGDHNSLVRLKREKR